MSEQTNEQTEDTAPRSRRGASSSGAGDGGASQVTERINNEQEQGFRGAVTDPTPNSAYTFAGVTSGEPTPETDQDAHHTARNATGVRFGE